MLFPNLFSEPFSWCSFVVGNCYFAVYNRAWVKGNGENVRSMREWPNQNWRRNSLPRRILIFISW